MAAVWPDDGPSGTNTQCMYPNITSRTANYLTQWIHFDKGSAPLDNQAVMCLIWWNNGTVDNSYWPSSAVFESTTTQGIDLFSATYLNVKGHRIQGFGQFNANEQRLLWTWDMTDLRNFPICWSNEAADSVTSRGTPSADSADHEGWPIGWRSAVGEDRVISIGNVQQDSYQDSFVNYGLTVYSAAVWISEVMPQQDLASRLYKYSIDPLNIPNLECLFACDFQTASFTNLVTGKNAIARNSSETSAVLPTYSASSQYTFPKKSVVAKSFSLPKLNHKSAAFKIPQYSRSQGYTVGPRRYDGKYKPDKPSVNKGHPLSKGLIWAFCSSVNDGAAAEPSSVPFKNLIGNQNNDSGRAWAILFEGGYEKGSVYFDNPSTANDYLYWKLPEHFLYRSGQTTTAVWVWTGTNQNENWLYDTEVQGDTNYLDAMSVGGTLTNPAPIKLYWQDAAGTERTFSTSVFDAQEGPRHCIASRIKSGAYADIWVDGIQQGVDTNGYTLRTSIPSGNAGITIGMNGQRTTSGAMQNGIYHLGYKWNRVLTDKEMEMIYEQPYLLVSPPQRAFLPDSSKSFTKFTRILKTGGTN